MDTQSKRSDKKSRNQHLEQETRRYLQRTKNLQGRSRSINKSKPNYREKTQSYSSFKKKLKKQREAMAQRQLLKQQPYKKSKVQNRNNQRIKKEIKHIDKQKKTSNIKQRNSKLHFKSQSPQILTKSKENKKLTQEKKKHKTIPHVRVPSKRKTKISKSKSVHKSKSKTSFSEAKKSRSKSENTVLSKDKNKSQKNLQTVEQVQVRKSSRIIQKKSQKLKALQINHKQIKNKQSVGQSKIIEIRQQGTIKKKPRIKGITKRYTMPLEKPKDAQINISQQPFKQQIQRNLLKRAQIDLCFCIDSTGSMLLELERFDSIGPLLLKKYQQFMKSQSLTIRVAVLAYKDHEEEFKTKFIDFTNFQQAQNFMKRIKAGGGGTQAQAVHDALLDCCMKLSWKAQSIHYLYHITDSPPHGSQFQNQNESQEGCTCGLKTQTIIQAINNKNILYRLVKTKPRWRLEKMQQIFSRGIKNFKSGFVNQYRKFIFEILDQKE